MSTDQQIVRGFDYRMARCNDYIALFRSFGRGWVFVTAFFTEDQAWDWVQTSMPEGSTIKWEV